MGRPGRADVRWCLCIVAFNVLCTALAYATIASDHLDDVRTELFSPPGIVLGGVVVSALGSAVVAVELRRWGPLLWGLVGVAAVLVGDTVATLWATGRSME